MVDVKALRDKIEESGMTITAIAERMQITRETLYNRIRSGDFKVSEAHSLTDILRLSEEERNRIFFN